MADHKRSDPTVLPTVNAKIKNKHKPARWDLVKSTNSRIVHILFYLVLGDPRCLGLAHESGGVSIFLRVPLAYTARCTLYPTEHKTSDGPVNYLWQLSVLHHQPVRRAALNLVQGHLIQCLQLLSASVHHYLRARRPLLSSRHLGAAFESPHTRPAHVVQGQSAIARSVRGNLSPSSLSWRRVIHINTRRVRVGEVGARNNAMAMASNYPTHELRLSCEDGIRDGWSWRAHGATEFSGVAIGRVRVRVRRGYRINVEFFVTVY